MTSPGWYQAPMDPGGVRRWWDGVSWTARVQSFEAPTPPRAAAPIPLRVAARAIDFVLAMALASAAHRVWAPRVLEEGNYHTDGLLRVDEIFPTDLGAASLLAVVAVFVLWELYWLLSEGATPGKQLLGLYVSDPDSLRGTVELIPAVKRNLHRTLGVIPYGWVLIGLTSVASLTLMVNDRVGRQSLMDRLAGTTVHRLPPGSPRLTPWLPVWFGLFIGLRFAASLLN